MPTNYSVIFSEERLNHINAIQREINRIYNQISVSTQISSTAGRVQMAEELLALGMITSPREYFDIVNNSFPVQQKKIVKSHMPEWF